MQPHVEAALSVLGDALASTGLFFFVRARSRPWVVEMAAGDVHGATGHPASAFDAPTFWRSRLHADDRERVVDELESLMEAGEPVRVFEYRLMDADGSPRSLRETVRRVARSAGDSYLSTVERADPEEASAPVGDRHRDPSPMVPEVAEPRSPDPSSLGILVVEDDQAVRSVIMKSLAGRGHTVVGVESAREALRAFDRSRPGFDIVIADVVLPDRSGVEVARALRRRRPALPVLFISGYDERTVVEQGVRFDVDPYLAKPFTRETLLRAVVEAVRAGGPDVAVGGMASG